MVINKIYNEDCLKTIDRMPDKFVDLIVTDPPYKINTGGGGIITRENKKTFKNIEKTFGSDFNPKKYLQKTLRICNPYNAYWWCSRLLLREYIDFAENNKFNYDIIVWNKTNPLPTKNNKYLPDTEYCIFMRGKNGAYWNNDLDYNRYRKVMSASVQVDNGHPTPKPEDFFINHILISSKPRNLIYDPFMGSGTTGMAALRVDRNYIGSEIDKDYYDSACKRIEIYKSQIKADLRLVDKTKVTQLSLLD